MAFETLGTADSKHRRKEHPRKSGERFSRTRQALAVTERPSAPVAKAEEAPEQMAIDFDENGLDLIGDALAEGVATIVASRRGLRRRVADLERQNAELLSMNEQLMSRLEAIRHVIEKGVQ